MIQPSLREISVRVFFFPLCCRRGLFVMTDSAWWNSDIQYLLPTHYKFLPPTNTHILFTHTMCEFVFSADKEAGGRNGSQQPRWALVDVVVFACWLYNITVDESDNNNTSKYQLLYVYVSLFIYPLLLESVMAKVRVRSIKRHIFCSSIGVSTGGLKYLCYKYTGLSLIQPVFVTTTETYYRECKG